MITKAKLRKQIEDLPEEFTIDELIERLLFLEKVERGLKQSGNGELITDDELSKEVRKWYE